MNEQQLSRLIERARYRGPTVRADQLVGLDACVRQLGGQLALIARPELARRFGLEPSGTLLIGPPGTGKTLVARYLAGRLDLPLYEISADEFGSDPELIHRVFRRLSEQRAIVFLDEVSILAQKREWGDAEDRRMLAALLTSLDGLASDREGAGLWVIGACTPDIRLDPAIHRSGRLGVIIEFALPSEEQRAALFRLYLEGVPHRVGAADIARLAEAATGASGADIRDWVSQAASEVLAEAEADDPLIEVRHLEAVVARRGFIGAEGRPGREPDWETAVHEAAHAVIAHVLFGREALARVVIGFGAAGALTGLARGHFALSDEWALNHPPSSVTWPDHVAVSLAGVCAEEALLGYRGAGAETDVADGTERILAQLDAADPAFGPGRRAIEGSSPVFQTVVGSGAMRELAWDLTRERFEACRSRTQSLVVEHRSEIERLAHVLLEESRSLTGDEIVAGMGGPRATHGSAGRPEAGQCTGRKASAPRAVKGSHRRRVR